MRSVSLRTPSIDIPFLSQNEPLSPDHQGSTLQVEPLRLPPFLSIDKNKPVCSELCLRCGLWSFCPRLPVCGHHVEWHNSQPLSIVFSFHKLLIHPYSEVGWSGFMHNFTRWGCCSVLIHSLTASKKYHNFGCTTGIHLRTSDHPHTTTAATFSRVCTRTNLSPFLLSISFQLHGFCFVWTLQLPVFGWRDDSIISFSAHVTVSYSQYTCLSLLPVCAIWCTKWKILCQPSIGWTGTEPGCFSGSIVKMRLTHP